MKISALNNHFIVFTNNLYRSSNPFCKRLFFCKCSEINNFIIFNGNNTLQILHTIHYNPIYTILMNHKKHLL
ncbi:unknown [Prevotella sp. CAG:1124]|nr:unknown [Prevotella sp. CAG:1124]